MGRAKALLATPDGRPLAQYQADLLRAAGCASAVVVLGSNRDAIAKALPQGSTVTNPNWRKGRFSSVQAGLQHATDADGCFILPVDTVGIRLETLCRMRDAAERDRPKALRATHESRPGHVAWLSADIMRLVLDTEPSPGTRLDILLRPHETRCEVADPAVLNNINTPEEWERARSLLVGN
jgi:CTP:molybdopterin cytidylyltransferase MocA